jgi:origin recognition complex subunit 1
MPCREDQFETISTFIRDNVVQETSRCMYVSGVPGTGKTLIVQSAINELKEHSPELEFNHVYINGLTLGSNPEKLWRKLWKELDDQKLTPKQALRKLLEYFQTRDILPTVLVVDELDQLMDKKQSVLYRLLEWTTDPLAKFTFIAIFNTMNLPESALVNRNASRIGFARVVFPPYDHSQLQIIVETSLLGEKRRKELSKDAVILLSRKVAAISGDARRALEIAKRALEILEASEKPGAKAVDEAFKELFSSPKIETIKDCTDLEKCILESVVSELSRSGSEETCYGPVLNSVLLSSSYDGKNWSSDNILVAVVRLVSMKLLVMESAGSAISALTRLSLNVPTEDVKFALAQNRQH